MPLMFGSDAMQFASGPQLLYEWKQFMVSTGVYTVAYSSNGTTHGPTDHIVSTSTLSTPRSYFILEDLTGHQFCFQNVSGSVHCRIKFSHSAKFTTSPGPLTTPSASDELVFYGGGTDASPTGTAIVSNLLSDYFYWCVDTKKVQDQYYWVIYGLQSGGSRSVVFGFFPTVPTKNDLRPYYLAAVVGGGSIQFTWYHSDLTTRVNGTLHVWGPSSPVSGLEPVITAFSRSIGSPAAIKSGMVHFKTALTSGIGGGNPVVTARGSYHLHFGYGPILKDSAFTIPGTASTPINAVDLVVEGDGNGGTPAVAILQRVWDTSNLNWCYYAKLTEDPAPLAVETIPNHSGSITSHQVL